jgi:cell division protein FtsI/penicillin-binding protein 2
VVGSPEGTANSAFRNSPDLHPFLFAKTGTATVQDDDDRRVVASTLGHTAWLAGYYDPRVTGTGARGPSPIGRRFAFACMVTHARGGTGGALCAPAMERILRRMAGGTPAPVRRAPLR